MPKIYFLSLLLVAVLLSGCQTLGLGGGKASVKSPQTQAALGANDLSATRTPDSEFRIAIETALGEKLDDGDAAEAAAAQKIALAQAAGGLPIHWRNSKNGHSGKAVSGPGYSINGRQCRDFVHHLELGSPPRSARGIACRLPSGQWEILSA